MRRKLLTWITAIVTISMLAICGRSVEAQQEKRQPPGYYVFNLADPGGGVCTAMAREAPVAIVVVPVRVR